MTAGIAFMNWGRLRAASIGLLITVTPVFGQSVSITVERVATGLNQPVAIASAPDDFERILVAEQEGRLRSVVIATGATTGLLDLSSKVSTSGEGGLLGLVFHPDFASNGHFFVNYTNVVGDTVISRYHAPNGLGNPANASSEEILLTIPQPGDRHNGGWIGFGPDGFLYIATGDGAAGDCDADGDSQNVQDNLLGKILRIDVDQGSPYSIPPDNPFVGVPGLDEIWSYGLRNPWRCAFDGVTGDFYIADVGQNSWEEVNFQPSGSAGGENYGWNCMEGNHCSTDSGCGSGACTCFDGALVDPIQEFDRSAGPAIIGGEVYRGCEIPGLGGTYFLANGDNIWSFQQSGGASTELTNRTAELTPPNGQDIRTITSFGKDAQGEIYLCDYVDGEIFKIIPTPGTDSGACDVPATSSWGAVVLLLLLLSMGTVLVTQRPHAAN